MTQYVVDICDNRDVECNNCEWYGVVAECHNISDVQERVDPGETFPAGECPLCGALAHLVEKKIMLVLDPSCLDYWGDSKYPVAVINGSTLEFVGNSDGTVSRRVLKFKNRRYEIVTSNGECKWLVLKLLPKDKEYSA